MSDEATFKEGDVVQLKCGSFPMVVQEVSGTSIKVVWADIKKTVLMECDISPALLALSDKPGELKVTLKLD